MEIEERRQNYTDISTIIGLINNRFDDLNGQFNSLKDFLHEVSERVVKVDYQLNNGIKAQTTQNTQDIRELNEKLTGHIIENTEKLQELQESITDNIIEKLSDKGYLNKPVPLKHHLNRILAGTATLATIIGTVYAVWQYYHP